MKMCNTEVENLAISVNPDGYVPLDWLEHLISPFIARRCCYMKECGPSPTHVKFDHSVHIIHT